jgi:hypothetical protein
MTERIYDWKVPVSMSGLPWFTLVGKGYNGHAILIQE